MPGRTALGGRRSPPLRPSTSRWSRSGQRDGDESHAEEPASPGTEKCHRQRVTGLPGPRLSLSPEHAGSDPALGRFLTSPRVPAGAAQRPPPPGCPTSWRSPPRRALCREKLGPEADPALGFPPGFHQGGGMPRREGGQRSPGLPGERSPRRCRRSSPCPLGCTRCSSAPATAHSGYLPGRPGRQERRRASELREGARKAGAAAGSQRGFCPGHDWELQTSSGVARGGPQGRGMEIRRGTQQVLSTRGPARLEARRGAQAPPAQQQEGLQTDPPRLHSHWLLWQRAAAQSRDSRSSPARARGSTSILFLLQHTDRYAGESRETGTLPARRPSLSPAGPGDAGAWQRPLISAGHNSKTQRGSCSARAQSPGDPGAGQLPPPAPRGQGARLDSSPGTAG